MKNKATLIIAEAGVNHNGSLEKAKRLIDTAAAAKADMVKFQTFSAERLVTTSAHKAEYQNQATDASESQYDMIRKLELTLRMHEELIAFCRQCDIDFLSTGMIYRVLMGAEGKIRGQAVIAVPVFLAIATRVVARVHKRIERDMHRH